MNAALCQCPKRLHAKRAANRLYALACRRRLNFLYKAFALYTETASVNVQIIKTKHNSQIHILKMLPDPSSKDKFIHIDASTLFVLKQIVCIHWLVAAD